MKISSYTENSPIFQMYRLNNSVQSYYTQRLKAHDVNFIQSLILLTIYFEGKKKVSPMFIVRGLGLSKSNVSQALSQLESQKKIKRRMDEEDARSLWLTLTAEGKSEAAKIISIFEASEKKFEKLGKAKFNDFMDALKFMSEIFEDR